MAILFSPITVYVATFLAGVFGFVYWFFTRHFDYWKVRQIPYIEPKAFFGNMKDHITQKKIDSVVFQDLYKELHPHKYGGVFQLMDPTLLLRDPEIIKTVMVKDFSYFQDRGFHFDTKLNPLAEHLFIIGGWKWRALRMKLTPTFTSGKMKMMFNVMEACAEHLQDYLAQPAAKGEIVEMKEIIAKYTTDNIGSIAFGLEMDALDNPDSQFRNMGRKSIQPSAAFAIRILLASFLPKVASFFKIPLFPSDVSEFFLNVVKETVALREKNNIKRNDFLQLLIELKNKGKLEDDETEKGEKENADSLHNVHKNPEERHLEMHDNLLAAQCFLFFLGGFETSSNTISFAIHELAVNTDIQTKLREEVDATLEDNGGKFTYDSIMNMKYLDKVLSETLRKYPAVGNVTREVTVPYTLPDKNAKLDVGTRVVIPIYGLHHDPKYFPNPERFDPERFSEEQKAKRQRYIYMPFGEGPRNCIGMRYALLQTKTGLAALLSKYEFHVCERTELPLVLDPRSGVTTSRGGINVRITNRSDK